MSEELVGRAGVLALLRTRLKPAAGPVLLLLGDAGSGLTSLLRTVAADAAEAGRSVLWVSEPAEPAQADLLIVDDAHRLNPNALRTLTHRTGARLLAAFHQDPDPLPAAETIRIGGLDAGAADRLLLTVAGDLTPAERRLIADHARGNPLALHELPVAWRAAGPSDAERCWNPPVTDRLATRLTADLAGLPAHTRAALDVLAVADEATIHQLVAVTTRLGHNTQPDLLSPAESRRLVAVHGRQVVFREPLLRAVLRHRLTFAERAHLHTELAGTTSGEARWWHAAQAAYGSDDVLAGRLAEVRAIDDMATVLRRSVVAAQLSSDPGERGKRLARAAAAAVQLGHRRLADHLRVQAGVDLAESPDCGDVTAGDPATAASQFAVAAPALAALSRHADLARVSALWAAAAFALGDWVRADQAAAEAVRLGTETGQLSWAAHGLAVQALLAACRGDARRCESLATQAEQLTPAAPVRTRLLTARAVTLLARDEPGAAYEMLSILPADRSSPEYAEAVGFRAEAALLAGRSAVALPPEPEPSPLLRANLLLAEALREDGHLAGLADWPWLLARARLAVADRLARAGRGTEARAQLHLAESVLRTLGAAPWVRRAAAPAHVREMKLSPQELAVVRLAAAGLTNAEIGARLYLSPRTVGSHLYRAFPKLGVSSRRELTKAGFAVG